jgi:hypothetical protein
MNTKFLLSATVLGLITLSVPAMAQQFQQNSASLAAPLTPRPITQADCAIQIGDLNGQVEYVSELQARTKPITQKERDAAKADLDRIKDVIKDDQEQIRQDRAELEKLEEPCQACSRDGAGTPPDSRDYAAKRAALLTDVADQKLDIKDLQQQRKKIMLKFASTSELVGERARLITLLNGARQTCSEHGLATDLGPATSTTLDLGRGAAPVCVSPSPPTLSSGGF